jgi:hypothetical protein
MLFMRAGKFKVMSITHSHCLFDLFFLSTVCVEYPSQVHKFGMPGRSLDVRNFHNYAELRSELAQMFNLEGVLDGSVKSGWQLVFVDHENDTLLVGDDPWE